MGLLAEWFLPNIVLPSYKEDSVAIDWTGDVGRRLDERLRSEHAAWMTTVRSDGTPQPSVVWFWWSGQEVLVYSADTPRVSNLEQNPRAALNFNADPEGGSVGILVGHARIDRGHPGPDSHEGYLDKYRGSIAGELGLTPTEFAGQYSVPILFTPESGRAW